jgi:hypothetical protein
LPHIGNKECFKFVLQQKFQTFLVGIFIGCALVFMPGVGKRNETEKTENFQKRNDNFRNKKTKRKEKNNVSFKNQRFCFTILFTIFMRLLPDAKK